MESRRVTGWGVQRICRELRAAAWTGILATIVTAGLAAGASSAAQAQSRFEGRWAGPWNDPATREDGHVGLGIAFDGDVRGRLDNPGRGDSGDFTGHIDESGHIDGSYVYDDRAAYRGRGTYRTYRVSGSLEQTGPAGDGLYGGIAFFDGPTRIGGAILSLRCEGGPCYRPRR